MQIERPGGSVEDSNQGGRRIFERQFYVTQNESKFQASNKVFSSVVMSDKDENKKASTSRPTLNSYRREFAMPDHLHVGVP